MRFQIIAASLLALVAQPAMARDHHGWHHGFHHDRGHHYGWMRGHHDGWRHHHRGHWGRHSWQQPTEGYVTAEPAFGTRPDSMFAPVAPLFAPAPRIAVVPRATVAPRYAAAPARSGPLDALIAQHAQANGVPESLVRRVVVRESRYNPRAVGRGGAMGLMQIKTATARAMGYGGSSSGLLNADTNLTYAVRYLAGAYRAAGGNANRAVGYYARGYYSAAKHRGIAPYAPPADAYASADSFQVASLDGGPRIRHRRRGW
jgi:soluble lytic murein transglycosylase-like protein